MQWVPEAARAGAVAGRGRVVGLQRALARRHVALALHGDGDDELARRLLDGLARAAARLRSARLRRRHAPADTPSTLHTASPHHFYL